jgi:hypothetical protein
MTTKRIICGALLSHAVAYFVALAFFGYSPERTFLLGYILGP